MLNIKVNMKNETVVVDGMRDLASRFPDAVMRGLERSAAGIFSYAYKWLSGAGSKKSRIASGGYPVPVRTGHLRRSLDWLAPGETKTGDLGTFSAGSDEVVIFDSAEYAPDIFLGLGSSQKFGPRDALRDALFLFDHGGNIQRVISEEIQKEINKK